MGRFRLCAASILAAAITTALPASAAKAQQPLSSDEETAAKAAPTYKIDHYIFYSLNRVEAKGRMRLRDQFDDKIWKQDRSYQIADPGLQYFGVPATKKVVKEKKSEKGGMPSEAPEDEKGGLLRADAHLSWYELIRTGQEERIKKIVRLRVQNQFGTAVIRIDIGFGNTRRILLVPAGKAKPDDPAPKIPAKFDHYQCYPVTSAPRGPSPKSKLQVVDQIVPDGHKIALFDAPRYFCAPVVKQRLKEGDEGKPIPDLKGLVNADDHLIIYRIDGGYPVKPKKQIKDQFLAGTINLFYSWWLGVPTKKLRVFDN